MSFKLNVEPPEVDGGVAEEVPGVPPRDSFEALSRFSLLLSNTEEELDVGVAVVVGQSLSDAEVSADQVLSPPMERERVKSNLDD